MSFEPWYPRGGASGTLVPTHPWDLIKLGGYALPGHARISSGGVEMKVDRKGAPGRDGASPTAQGMDPKPLSIEVFIWTVEQADALERVIVQVGPIPGGTAQAISIDAQALRHLPISSVMVTGVTALMPANEGGATGKKCAIQCLHWLAPPKGANKTATKTPTRSVGNKITDDANKKNPKNPPPTQQQGFSDPPR